jgi:nucleoside-diphosphate-sugar epimerase
MATMRVLLTGGGGTSAELWCQVCSTEAISRSFWIFVSHRICTNKRSLSKGLCWIGPRLQDYFRGCACIVHIAAWHGIHEDRSDKDAYDFFDLNVRGTFEVFAAAAAPGINKIVYISTTSVRRPDTLYGRSKILAERIAEDYSNHGNMNVITLRPRGFIPYWNRDVYTRYSDWARWFCRGAVHINDVAAAVMLGMDLMSRRQLEQHLKLTLDSGYEYTDADLDRWDADGAGSTFRKHYSEYYDLALSYGLDPALKPNKLDISETVRWLSYQPSYSLSCLLRELAAYGDSGPPRFNR